MAKGRLSSPFLAGGRAQSYQHPLPARKKRRPDSGESTSRFNRQVGDMLSGHPRAEEGVHFGGTVIIII